MAIEVVKAASLAKLVADAIGKDTNGIAKAVRDVVPAAPAPSTIPDGTRFNATSQADGSWLFVVDSTATPPPAMPTTVTIPASKYPTMTDAAGTDGDHVTLHAAPGVRWRVQAPATSAGVEYAATAFGGQPTLKVPVSTGGAAEVTAIAETGYVLSGTSSWSFTFTNTTAATKVTIPVGSVPTAQDLPDMANDTVTLTKVDGVIWNVDGTEHPSSGFAGTSKVVPYTKGQNVTVTASPASSDYAINGTSSWTLVFTNTPATTSEGWTPAYPRVTLSGVPDGPLAVGSIIGGNGTTTGVKVVKGTVQAASETFLVPVGSEGHLAALGGVDRKKVRFSFTQRAVPEPFGRQTVILMGGTGAQVQIGLLSANNGWVSTEDPYLTGGMSGTKGTTTHPTKIGDTITLEWATEDNTMHVYVNGVLVESRVASKPIPNVKNVYFVHGLYSADPLSVDDLLVEEWK